LNAQKAQQIVDSQPIGLGPGVLALDFLEHPYFRGNYILYLQVERVGDDKPKLEKLPNPIPDGSMWRQEHDDKVYVIYGGAKFWVPSPSYVNQLGGWQKVKIVQDGALDAVSLIPKEGTYLREDGLPAVFVMRGGKRCYFPNFKLFESWSGPTRWRVVRVVPNGGLQQIPLGEPVNNTDKVIKPIPIIK
jgi:hypothetical protein